MANKYPLVLTGTTVEEIQSTDVIPVDAGGTGVTTSTGTGSVVLSTSPTLVTPALGTPSSGTLTNCTGLPATGGGTGQSSYTTGDLLYASSSTALAKLADVATGNALISGGVGVAPSWGKVGLTTHVTGTLPVANGGTGTTSLTANNVLLGNGTSALQVVAPGTAGNILTSNGTTWTSSAAPASGVTTFSAGTTGFTPSTATSGAVTLAGTLAATNGGTGQTTYAVGDLLYASTTTALSKLADVATGNSLISGGVGVAPSWGKIGLTTHVSGTLPVANGGTGVTTSTGSGSVVLSTSPTLTTPILGTPSSGTLTSCTGLPLTTGVTGTLPVANGGTGQTTYAVGDLLYASTTTALSKLADVATGNALISGGVGVAPSWGKIGLTTHVSGTLPIANGGTNSTATPTAGGVAYGTGTAYAITAAGTAGQVLTSNGASAPTWTTASSLLGATDSASPFETALGYQAGNVNTGTNNVFVGYQTGLVNTTGAANTAVGYWALNANTTGTYNTAVGYFALQANTIGIDNTAVGNLALRFNTTGTNNTAVGDAALYSNTTGIYNTAVGSSALYSNTTGTDSTAQGYQALYSNTTGLANVAIGYGALYSSTTGSYNAALGYNAGVNATGSYNTIIGHQAGQAVATTGNNNTLLGYSANTASTASANTITLGNSSIATLRCQVTTITALSDARDKTDIAELDAGLDFINALAPVSFTWDMRDGGKVGEPDTGFIAQELVQAQEDTGHYIPGLVYDENPERLEAGYGKLIPVLVKAIQELSAEVSALKSELNGANNG